MFLFTLSLVYFVPKQSKNHCTIGVFNRKVFNLNFHVLYLDYSFFSMVYILLLNIFAYISNVIPDINNRM